ncbi:hypothetical protein [Bacillus sp. JCM 19034]|uniref:hypothetical protein n=1 Tax=Bacillus sp. JCM 19034 TaxID=1481928 RepID=UPI000783FD80|nr:hypothetical protein [Bacillus sp. JCM 19034]
MNKYNAISSLCLGIFVILFFMMINDVSSGSLGRIAIISMCLFPLLGAIVGLKAKNSFGKWIIIILNLLAFITIAYLLLLGFGMGGA